MHGDICSLCDRLVHVPYSVSDLTLAQLLQYRSMDNQGWWASFLYILLVLFVALIMMNLFTAVLKLKLAKAMSTMVCPPCLVHLQTAMSTDA